MTGNPMRPADVEGGSAGRQGADAMPDPWGVRRAENLLASLEGVLSARVVTTPLGEVSEVHVLASSGLQPKQVVRNVESALLAHLGVKVDHRKISVAQTADVRPIAAVESGGVVRDHQLRRTVLFEDMGVATAERPNRVAVAVTVTSGGRTETGREEVVDTSRGRLEGAAKATAAALERLINKGALVVEGVKVVEALDRSMVFVVVRGMGGRDSRVLTGTAEVRESAERAAVFAVLDATNRWVEARRAG